MVKKLTLLLLLGIMLFLGIWLALQDSKTDEGFTLVPIRQLLGKGPAAIDQVLARALPAGEMDEAAYGNIMALRFTLSGDTLDPRYGYVNQVLDTLLTFTQKPFDYHVYVQNASYVNAYACPGGVLVVTTALLDSLQSESELASVLAHELGHVELGHCFALVKFQLAAKKIGARKLGKLADATFNILSNATFNQNQETQADAYAWEMLIKSPYDLSGMGDFFSRLTQKENRAFGTTHPPSSMRREEYREKAADWYGNHPETTRYRGAINVAQMRSVKQLVDSTEWVRGGGYY